MSNQRQNHEQNLRGKHRHEVLTQETARVKGRSDELRKIYPPLADSSFDQEEPLSPQSWQQFSREIHSRLLERPESLSQVLRDRVTTSEHRYTRWIWMLLLAAAIVIGLIVSTAWVPQPLPPSTAHVVQIETPVSIT